MFMVATRNFPPEVGGMQNLIEGLSNALLKQYPYLGASLYLAFISGINIWHIFIWHSSNISSRSLGNK